MINHADQIQCSPDSDMSIEKIQNHFNDKSSLINEFWDWLGTIMNGHYIIEECLDDAMEFYLYKLQK